MEKLLLVDGHYLLFQMFYGMPARIRGKNGKPVQAVIGFTGALLKVLKSVEATRAVVLFDGETGSFRTDESDSYKAGRKDYTDAPDDDNPFAQLDDIKAVLQHLEIKHFEIDEKIETDDLIAAYVSELKDDYKIYILSGDTDFMQLVSENVSVYVYRGKKSVIYDPATVFAKFGVMPQFFADFKALAGDSSDNICGIKGIGAKTAKKLIDGFGHVEDIIQNADLIEKTSVRAMVKANTDLLLKNLHLIKPALPVKVPFSVESLCLKAYNNHRTMDILKQLDML